MFRFLWRIPLCFSRVFGHLSSSHPLLSLRSWCFWPRSALLLSSRHGELFVRCGLCHGGGDRLDDLWRCARVWGGLDAGLGEQGAMRPRQSFFCGGTPFLVGSRATVNQKGNLFFFGGGEPCGCGSKFNRRGKPPCFHFTRVPVWYRFLEPQPCGHVRHFFGVPLFWLVEERTKRETSILGVGGSPNQQIHPMPCTQAKGICFVKGIRSCWLTSDGLLVR